MRLILVYFDEQIMNPEFNVKALQERVSPQTEEVFDDKFWSSLSLVTNALVGTYTPPTHTHTTHTHTPHTTTQLDFQGCV